MTTDPAVDPLRAFLANPGVGQVEELAWTYEEANTRASREGANVAEATEAGVCAVLAALADEFGVQR